MVPGACTTSWTQPRGNDAWSPAPSVRYLSSVPPQRYSARVPLRTVSAPSDPAWSCSSVATPGTQLINQTDLNWKFATGPFQHNLVHGAAFSNETYDLTTGNILRTDQGATVVLAPVSIANPVNVYTGPVNYLPTTISDGEVSNQAIYLFDNIEIGPQWSINGGIRFEHNEGEFFSTPYTYTANAPNPPILVAGTSTNSQN